jgi:hypothetical protein
VWIVTAWVNGTRTGASSLAAGVSADRSQVVDHVGRSSARSSMGPTSRLAGRLGRWDPVFVGRERGALGERGQLGRH